MQNIVVLWCELVGVSDPAAQRVAVGMVAGGLPLAALLLIVHSMGRAWAAMERKIK